MRAEGPLVGAAVACVLWACTHRATTAAAEPARPQVVPVSASAQPVPTGCGDPLAPRRITLAHFNDLQARYGERLGGHSRYAYLAGYLRALKQERPTLVLDAGDDYEKGSIADLRSMGEVTRQMVQALPIDVRTMGNHDFAYGEAAVLRDVHLSGHPVLSANVHRGMDQGPFAPYAEFVVGCVKVGVIGMTISNYGADDQPTREPYAGVFLHDDRYWVVLAEQVRKHRGQVDILIALTHLGARLDTLLAYNQSDVDFFVGGHSEEVLTDLETARNRERTQAFVMQAGHYGQLVGRADVVVTPGKRLVLERYTLVTVDESLPMAADVSELASRLTAEVAPDAERPIARLDSAIANGRPMVDLVLRAAKATWGVDGVVIGRDTFWEGLPAGSITLQRLYDSVYAQRQPAGTPGFTSLYVATLTGAEIIGLRQLLSDPFVVIGPEKIIATQGYKMALEKRVVVYPFGTPRFAQARFAGEVIDLLEGYARARSAVSLPL